MRALLAIVIVSIVAAAGFGGRATEYLVNTRPAVEALPEIVVEDVAPMLTQDDADAFYRAVTPVWPPVAVER